MSTIRVLIAAATVAACAGIAAPATDPPPVTAFDCVVGDTWTYQYSAKGPEIGAGLNGSETWTRTACGDRYVAHPGGHIVNSDVVSDPQGNLYAGYSGFSGAAQTYNKPYPLGRLPLAPGKSWDAPTDITMAGGRGLNGSGHWSVSGWEMVTVPAGTYLCIRTDVKMNYSFLVQSAVNGREQNVSGIYQETTWYSPALRTTIKSTSSDNFGDSATRQLTAITLK